MPVLTSPPLVGGAGKPVTGRVAVQATAEYEWTDGVGVVHHVTTTPQAAVVRDGQFFDLDGSTPLTLIPTPLNVGMRVVLHLDESGAQRGQHVVSRVVEVPNVSTVAWGDLVDVVPPVVGGDYVIPPWASDVVTYRDQAGVSATNAAASAAAAQTSATNAAGSATAAAQSATDAQTAAVAGVVIAAGSAATTVQAKLDALAAGAQVVFNAGTYAAPAAGFTVPVNDVTIDASRARFTQAVEHAPVFDLAGRDGVRIDVGEAERTVARTGTGVSFRGGSGYLFSSVVWANGDRNWIKVRRAVNFTCAVFLSGWAGTGTYDRQGVGNVVDVDEVSQYDFGVLWTWQKDTTIRVGFAHDDADASGGTNPTHAIYGSADATYRDSGVTILDGRAERNLFGHAYQVKYSDRLKVGTLVAHDSAGHTSLIDCHDLDAAAFVGTEMRQSADVASFLMQSSVTPSQRPRVGVVSMGLTSGNDKSGALIVADDGDFPHVQVTSNHSALVGSGVRDIDIRGARNRVHPVNVQRGTAARGVSVGAGPSAPDTILDRPIVRGATVMVNILGGSTGVVVDYDPLAQSVTEFIDTTSGTGAESWSTRSRRKVTLSTFGEESSANLMVGAGTCTVGIANGCIQRKVRPTRDVTVTALRWWSATASGSYDIAIVNDATDARLWSKGATAWPAAGVIDEAVAGVVLRAGCVYRVAFAADNTTGALRGLTGSFGGLDVALDGTAETTLVAAAFPIPTPLVAGTVASVRIPLIAVLGT